MADLGNRTNVNAAIDTLLDDLAPNNSIQPSDHNGLLKDILDTLANGLSVALRTGNTTSGQNLEITSGDSIQFDNSTFLGSLVSGTLTGAQTYTLPDKSGTVAMTSDISNILTANGIVMTGTYSHDLAGNTLTMDGGVINVTNGGFGVLGSGNVTSDGINNVLFSFIGSSGHQTLIVRDDNDSVAIGTSAADLSSVFEVASTTKGVLFPRMSTAERDLIALPVESLLIYNTTNDQFEFRSSGASWDALGGGASLYSQDDTIGSGRIATLTDTLSFEGGTVKIEGADTLSTSTAFEIYDGDVTPNKLWDFRNNGDVVQGGPVNWTLGGALNFIDSGSDISFNLNVTGGGYWTGGVITVGEDAFGKVVFPNSSGGQIDFYNGANIAHRIQRGANNQEVGFFRQGFSSNKKVLLGGSALIGSESISLQGKTHVGTVGQDNSAILSVGSTTQGLLPPRMTTTQRDAIGTPAAGLTVYNTTTNKLNFYNGSAWEAVTSA